MINDFLLQEVYSNAGIYRQGTGLAEDGRYITIDWTKNNQVFGSDTDWIDKTNPVDWYFTYGKGGYFDEGTPFKSVAISQDALNDPLFPLRMNDTVKIGLSIYPDNPDSIFKVYDTGTFANENQLDVFIGVTTYADALVVCQ